MTEKPFANIDELRNWVMRNCERCTKELRRDVYKCDMFPHLCRAYIVLNGDIPYDIARRIGYYDEGGLEALCNEMEMKR